MLEFLETGKAIYALAGVCMLGLLGKWITRNLYKRLIRETDNMQATKNKYLRTLKQKAESTYRMNQGISNTGVYLERQLYSFRFLGVTLNGWNNYSNQMTMLCFLLGALEAFAAYWYNCESYYIVLYAATGAFAGLICMTADSGLNPSERKKQLLVSLQDYMDNFLFNKIVLGQRAITEPVEPVNRKDIDYLKKSLDQIAVSREKTKEDEQRIKELEPEEIKVIGEILKEYLS